MTNMELLPPRTDGDEAEEEAAGDRGLRCAGERACATGLIAGDDDESNDRSIDPVVPM